jgi:hypothetical protein
VHDLSSLHYDNGHPRDISHSAFLFEVRIESSQVAGIRTGLCHGWRPSGEMGNQEDQRNKRTQEHGKPLRWMKKRGCQSIQEDRYTPWLGIAMRDQRARAFPPIIISGLAGWATYLHGGITARNEHLTLTPNGRS